MRNLKKVLSLALALVMLVGMMVVGAGAVETSFKDDSKIGEEYKEAVAVMNAIGVLNGKDAEGNFDPQGTLTRAEAAAILVRMTMGTEAAKGLANVNKSGVFTDMADHWAAGYVDACYNQGIVLGMDVGIYGPNNTLTGTQFAAMLLRAIGVEGEFTGNAWQSAVIAAANKAGLSGVITGNIAREAASKMAFDGLQYSPSGEKTYKVGDQTFSSAADAYFYQQSLKDNPKPEIKVTTAKDSLAATVFGLARGENTTDDFGRPTNAWTIDGQPAVELVNSEPVLTYTETVTEKQLFADLGVTGRKESGDYYVVMDEIWYDGKQVATATEKKSGNVTWFEAADTSTLCQESVIIAKNTNKNMVGSGNGVTVEVYSTGTANHYKMVIVNEYVATISSVSKATATTDRKVNFTGATTATGVMPRSFVTEDFAKGDVVLYTVAGTDVAEMKLAEKVEDAKTTSKTTTSVTTDNGEYKFHVGVANNLSLGKTANLYLDSCGNIILTDASAPASNPTTFAYILGAAGESQAATGVSAAGYTVQVKAALDDGTVKVYDVKVDKLTEDDVAENGAYYGVSGASAGDFGVAGKLVYDNDSNGTKDLLTANDASDTGGRKSLLVGKAFGYTLSDDGKTMTLIAPKSTSLSGMSEDKIHIGEDGVAKGGTSLTSATNVLVNSATKFVIIKNDETGASVYNGKVSGAITGAQVVVEAKGSSTGVAKVVFVKGEQTGVTTGVQLAYVDITTLSETLAEDGKTTVYNYTAKTADNDVPVTSKSALAVSGVYEISSDDKVVGDAKTPSLANEIAGSGMMNANDATGTAAYRNYDKDTVNIVSGLDTDEWVGKMCVVELDREGNVTTIFVVREAGSDATLTFPAATGVTASIAADAADSSQITMPTVPSSGTTRNVVIALSLANGVASADDDTIAFTVTTGDPNATITAVTTAVQNGSAVTAEGEVRLEATDAKTWQDLNIVVTAENGTSITYHITVAETTRA